MEAGVTTATKRLRRAGVAGFATIATVGGLVLTTGGTALAFQGAGATSGGATLTAGSSVVVYPGVANQALSNITLTLPDGVTTAGNGWNAGDFITFQVNNQSDAELCATASNANASASLAKPTVTATTGASSTAFTGFTVTQKSGSNCSANDQFVLTLTSGAPSDTATTTFTISGLSLSLGTNFPTAPTAVHIGATASNGVPFGTVGTGTASANISVATTGTVSVTAGTSVGATAGTATTLTIPSITVKDVVGGSIATNVNFNLPGTLVWKTAGSLSAPSGVVLGAATGTGTATLTYPISSGTVGAGGTFVLSGAQVTTGTGDTGSQAVTVKSGATTLGSAVQVAFLGGATRIGGADRYATAALIYSQKYGAANTAVIASGANFPDALSATVLAAAKSTGVLLTDPNTLSSSTKQALITGTGPVATVYIVGGPAAVSDNVFNQIAALKNSGGNAINVIRVFGADRYATNAAVDLQAGVTGSLGGGSAIVATGQNFADALAVGPAVYATGWPLILTPTADLNATAKSTISALGISNAVIVGGPKAVSATAEASLKTAGVTVTNRIAGDTRTQTAAEIAKWELTGTGATFAESGYNGNKGLGFSGTTVNIARGDTYPDALAAGAWLGNSAVTQVLLLTDSPTALGAGIPAVLNGANGKYSTTNVNAIGLAAALSTPVVTAAVGAIS
jgi:putative cell wall-binding protein